MGKFESKSLGVWAVKNKLWGFSSGSANKDSYTCCEPYINMSETLTQGARWHAAVYMEVILQATIK